MNKILARVGIIVAIALCTTGLVAAPASAHHTTVTGKAVCNTETGLFDLTWSIVNSENRTATFTSRLGSGSLSPRGTATQSEQVGPGSYRLTVDAVWSNGVRQSSTSNKVYASGDCERTRPPEPPADKEKRHLTSAPNCKNLTVVTRFWERDRSYSFDEDSWSWKPGEWTAFYLVDTIVRDATVKDCPPPPPVKTVKHRVKVKVVDLCNCWRDSARVIADRSDVKVTKRHPSRTKWVFIAKARRAADKLVYNGRVYENSVRIVLRTTNKKCAGAGTPGPHPNLPPVHCRGGC